MTKGVISNFMPIHRKNTMVYLLHKVLAPENSGIVKNGQNRMQRFKMFSISFCKNFYKFSNAFPGVIPYRLLNSLIK